MSKMRGGVLAKEFAKHSVKAEIVELGLRDRCFKMVRHAYMCHVIEQESAGVKCIMYID